APAPVRKGWRRTSRTIQEVMRSRQGRDALPNLFDEFLLVVRPVGRFPDDGKDDGELVLDPVVDLPKEHADAPLAFLRRRDVSRDLGRPDDPAGRILDRRYCQRDVEKR